MSNSNQIKVYSGNKSHLVTGTLLLSYEKPTNLHRVYINAY